MRQEVNDDGQALPLDRCFMLREGSDVTLVTWGAMTVETLRAAERARQARASSAEVIDLATLRPIDFETILESVAKTGRLVIVHEAARNVGRRRRDRRHRRRARPLRSAGAHPARHRLRHHHAAVQARARLHPERRSASSTRCALTLAGLEDRHEHIQASGFGRGLGRGRDPRMARQVGDHIGSISRCSRWRPRKRWSRYPALQRHGDRAARRGRRHRRRPARR